MRILPEGGLDASDVVLIPVPLGHLLLADWNTGPLNSHDGYIVNIVLIELKLECRVVISWPLIQSPGLHNLLWLLEDLILAANITAEDLENAANFGAVKALWLTTGEGSDALGIGECFVELGGWATELLGVGDSSSVNRSWL